MTGMWLRNRMPMTANRNPVVSCVQQRTPLGRGKGPWWCMSLASQKGERVGETQDVHDRYQGACVLIIGLVSDGHFAHLIRTCSPATRIMASKHHQSAQIIAREGSATRRYCPTPAVLATADQDQDQWRPLVPTTLWRCVLCLPGWL